MSEADDTTDMPARPIPPIVSIVLGVMAIAALGFAMFSNQWLYAEATQLQYNHGEGRYISTLGDVHERNFGLRTTTSCMSGNRGCLEMSNAELVEEWSALALQERFMLREDVDAELEERIGRSSFELMSRMRERYESPENKSHDSEALDHIAGKHIYQTAGAFSLLGWITFICIAIAVPSLLIAVGIVLAGKRVRLPVMPTTTALVSVGIALITGCVFVAMKPGPPGYVGVGIGFFIFGGGVVLGLWSSLSLNRLMRPHDHDLLEDAMNPEEFDNLT